MKTSKNDDFNYSRTIKDGKTDIDIERQASLFDRSNNKSAPILADRSYEREIICIFVFNLEYLWI